MTVRTRVIPLEALADRMSSLNTGLWTDEHLQKWDDLEEANMDDAHCALCRKDIETSVCLSLLSSSCDVPVLNSTV